MKNKPYENKMELINKLSRRRLDESEVYTFNITLCDNEIDRDFEAFSPEALKELGKLFVGKTGISDHSMRSKDQTARIYDTWIEKDGSRKTSGGQPYIALKAAAYTVRTEKNADLISEIDAGIKKEISIGCAVKEKICSLCGKDMNRKECNHIKGKEYAGGLCYAVLSGVTDAYEWSFVAVPAQREAGVTKAFNKKEREIMENPGELLFKSISQKTELSDKERELLIKYVEELEKKALMGESYRQELVKEVRLLATITIPEISQKAFEKVCENMDTDTLREFRSGLLKKKKSVLPAAPQLFAKKEATTENNNEYKI